MTEPSLEEVAANSPHPKAFQIYVRGDTDWLKALLRRVVAEAADKLGGLHILALQSKVLYYLVNKT